MEQRVSRLEKILHRILCCDTHDFTGPQGPPGPQGIQGPPGVDGLITFQNLNWMGEFVPCVIYNQFDAVSYNGSSYFMNCESSASYECELPTENPACWILLANAGATGPQGPTGESGNDGANSGRWGYQGLQTLGLPSSEGFKTNVLNLAGITQISINKVAYATADYTDWLSILDTLLYEDVSPAYLQITEVGNNAIVGVYKIVGSEGFSGPIINQSLTLNLEYVAGQAVNLVPTKNYTISWVLNGLGVLANKSVEYVTCAVAGETLPADYNVVTLTSTKTDFVILPDTDRIGKEVVVYVKDSPGDAAYIVANSEVTYPSSVPTSTGYIANHGIDNGSSNFIIYPNGNYKFTFLGNIAAGGKAFWIMEALPNTYPSINSGSTLYSSSTHLNSYYYSASFVALTNSDLNTLFPNLSTGEQVFAPNQPGGAKIFIKAAFGWLSQTLNPVL